MCEFGFLSRSTCTVAEMISDTEMLDLVRYVGIVIVALLVGYHYVTMDVSARAGKKHSA